MNQPTRTLSINEHTTFLIRPSSRHPDYWETVSVWKGQESIGPLLTQEAAQAEFATIAKALAERQSRTVEVIISCRESQLHMLEGITGQWPELCVTGENSVVGFNSDGPRALKSIIERLTMAPAPEALRQAVWQRLNTASKQDILGLIAGNLSWELDQRTLDYDLINQFLADSPTTAAHLRRETDRARRELA